MIQDTQAHLDLMEEREVQELINKAKEINLNQIISCSTSFSSNQKNLELARKFNLIKPAIGLYPLNALELNEEELKKAFDFFEK